MPVLLTHRYHDSWNILDDGAVQQKKKKQQQPPKVHIYRRPNLFLYRPTYTALSEVARTVHFADSLEVFRYEGFPGYPVTPRHQTSLPVQGRYSWFHCLGIHHSPHKNDWYGNVKFAFNFLNILKNAPWIRMFHIDLHPFVTSSASRILLTRRKEFFGSRELKLNELTYGDPIRIINGRVYFVTSHNYGTASDHQRFRHEVEFAVDLETISGTQLLSLCTITTVDHSKANSKFRSGRFGYHQCLKYNTYKETCPSPWTMEQTRMKLLPHMNGYVLLPAGELY